MQLLQALVEQLAQGLDVGGRPRDQPARGVALVEVQAERLGVPEDPAAQLQQHVLVDPGGDPDERVLEHAGGQRARRYPAPTATSGPCRRARKRRDAAVDGVGHQQRARLHAPPAGPAAAAPATATRVAGRAAATAAGRRWRPGGAGSTSRSKGSPRRSPDARVGGAGSCSSGVAVSRSAGPSGRWSSALLASSARSRPRVVSSAPDISHAAYSRRSSRSSSLWVPTAAIRPPDSSATRSASSTVEGRCATTRAVVSPSTRAAPPRPAPRCARPARTADRPGPGTAAAHHRPGQREPLPLAAGQAQPLLADLGVRRPAAARGRSRPGRCPAPAPDRVPVASGRPSGRSPPTVAENRVGLLERHRHQARSWSRGQQARCPRRPA